MVEFTGAEAAVALASGTAALHLALLLHGVGPGRRGVGVDADLRRAGERRSLRRGRPALHRLRARDLEHGSRTCSRTRSRRRPPTDRLPKAVIAVDLYGQCAQLDRIAELCDRYERGAHRGRRRGARCDAGRVAHAGAWGSLGGVVVQRQQDHHHRRRRHAARRRASRSTVRATSPSRPASRCCTTSTPTSGTTTGSPTCSPRSGRGQLAGLPGEDRPPPRDPRAPTGTGSATSTASSSCRGTTEGVPNGWLTLITLDPSIGVDAPRSCAPRSEADDIEARPAWKPMHLQPVFAGVPVVGGEVAEDLFDRGVCLPSGSAMSDERRGACRRGCARCDPSRTPFNGAWGREAR